jgi:hypothetical protein
MADYSSVKIRGEQILPFQTLLLTKDSSVADGYVGFEPGAKEGSVWTESNETVTEIDYTGAPVTESDLDAMEIFDNKIYYAITEYRKVVKQNNLTNTIFSEDMGAGAEKRVSQTFLNYASESFSGAIANQQMINRWQGITTATKAAIAALTPGAGQGSISAATQAKIAALPIAKRDGFFATMVYNTFRTDAVAGLGEYIKVDGTTIDATNIADQYNSLYNKIPADVLNDTDKPVVIEAPLAHRQLMRTANNSVGAASNQNFLFENDAVDSRCSYNGVMVSFVNLPANVMIAHPSKALFINADAKNEKSNFMEIGKMANGSDWVYFKNVWAYNHAVMNQNRNVLYS